MDESVFFSSFTACFLAYLLKGILHFSLFKNLIKTTKIVNSIGQVINLFIWLSWFIMVFNDPYKLNIPEWTKFFGIALCMAAILIEVRAETKFNSFHKSKGAAIGQAGVIIDGIYAYLRHPMYFGFVLWIIGFPLFMQSSGTLVSGIVWIIHYIYWGYTEELDLMERYSEYDEYRKKTGWF